MRSEWEKGTDEGMGGGEAGTRWGRGLHGCASDAAQQILLPLAVHRFIQEPI